MDNNERYAKLLVSLLQAELKKPLPLQCEPYCDRLLSLIKRNPDSKSGRLLTLVVDKHPRKSISNTAQSALRNTSDSLRHLWLRTRIDSLSTLDSRAKRLEFAVKTERNAYRKAHMIFAAMKGRPLESIFDPRAAFLHKLLQEKSEIVKMACCWALLAQGSFDRNIEDFLGSIEILLDVAVNRKRTTRAGRAD